MNRRLFLTAFVLAISTLCAAQTNECAKVERNGASVTVIADSIRAVDSIANALAQRFGILVSAEEPQYQYSEDFEDVSTADPQWSAEHPTAHYLLPKRRRIEVRFPISGTGTPLDVRAVLQRVVEEANQQTPFGYRLDIDGEFFALVPTTTRNANGKVIPATPLLDREVTVPAGTRQIRESAKMMADALSAQTGLRVSCCQSGFTGIPWGMAVVPFEATDEPARKVLERLIALDQESNTVSSRKNWLLHCDKEWCFINLSTPFGGGCR
jgi:hypothetical protein